MKAIKAVLLSLWSYWFLITLAYLLTFEGSGDPKRWNHGVNSFLGLFTPMAVGNLIGSSDHLKWMVTFPVLFGGLFFGDMLGKRLPWSRFSRPLYNLAVLVLLTMAIDGTCWGEWRSLWDFKGVLEGF